MCRGHRAATPVVVEVGLVVVVHFIRTVERSIVDSNPIAVVVAVAGHMGNRMLASLGDMDIVAAYSVGMRISIRSAHEPFLREFNLFTMTVLAELCQSTKVSSL